MEEKRIQTQIALYMTNKKLCEFIDKLKSAPIEYYGHIHSEGKRTGDASHHRSCIGLVLQDYSAGTGNRMIRVSANLTPEFFPYILTRISQGVDVFEFNEEKIFGTPAEDGMSQVTKVSFKRAPVGQDGQVRNYPWCITVENGRALKERTNTGGFHIKKGSYQKDRSVFVTLTDYDFYRLMIQTARFIQAWELTMAPKQIRDALSALDLQRAPDLKL